MTEVVKAERALKYFSYTLQPNTNSTISLEIPKFIMIGYGFYHFPRTPTNWTENDIILSRFSISIASDEGLEIGDLADVHILDTRSGQPGVGTNISSFVIKNDVPSLKTKDTLVYENIFLLQENVQLYNLYSPNGFENKHLNMRFYPKQGRPEMTVMVKQEAIYLGTK